MTERVWTPSNGLSLLRVLLVAPVVALLLSGEGGWAAALIVLAALTDWLDGLLARRRNEVTRLGRILDPLADKIGIGAVAAVLTLGGALPLWFTAAVVLRDLAIVGAAYALSGRGRAVPQSNPVGKWTAAVLALVVFIAVLDPADSAGTRAAGLAAGALMIALSSASYARRLFAGDAPSAGPSR